MNTRGIDNYMTFGKYRGKEWAEIPTSYLVWLKGQMEGKMRAGRHAWGSGTLYPRLVKELESRSASAERYRGEVRTTVAAGSAKGGRRHKGVT